MTATTWKEPDDPMSATAAARELPRLLPPAGDGNPAQDLMAHLARHGRLPYRDGPGVLLSDITAAGLTGRGGAAFPVHRNDLVRDSGCGV